MHASAAVPDVPRPSVAPHFVRDRVLPRFACSHGVSSPVLPEVVQVPKEDDYTPFSYNDDPGTLWNGTQGDWEKERILESLWQTLTNALRELDDNKHRRMLDELMHVITRISTGPSHGHLVPHWQFIHMGLHRGKNYSVCVACSRCHNQWGPLQAKLEPVSVVRFLHTFFQPYLKPQLLKPLDGPREPSKPPGYDCVWERLRQRTMKADEANKVGASGRGVGLTNAHYFWHSPTDDTEALPQPEEEGAMHDVASTGGHGGIATLYSMDHMD